MVDTKTYNKLHGIPPKSDPARKELDMVLFESDEPPQGSFPLLLPTEIKAFNFLAKKWG